MNDMNDSNNSGDKTLTVPPTKTLSLKRPVEQGVVRQSFSHGRSKAVVVEKVKRRVHGPGEAVHVAPKPAAPSPSPAAPAPGPQSAQPAHRPPVKPVAPRPQTGVVLRTLTDDERDARTRALSDSRVREEDDRKRQEAEARVRAEREARERDERDAAEARKKEEETRLTREAEAKRKGEEEARRRLSPGPVPAAAAVAASEPDHGVSLAPPSGAARRPQQIVFTSPRPAPAAPSAAAPVSATTETRTAASPVTPRR
ncbi:translation initiation factor IF-2 associated domain-containing protein, partial [Rhodoblastus sp.]|uniref:translation initiation factor IF-2 associated domain-containing protein n=1 Tax=Rhodoblastus sp. TaxID=1962975 RepID=UPI003F98C55D